MVTHTDYISPKAHTVTIISHPRLSIMSGSFTAAWAGVAGLGQPGTVRASWTSRNPEYLKCAILVDKYVQYLIVVAAVMLQLM